MVTYTKYLVSELFLQIGRNEDTVFAVAVFFFFVVLQTAAALSCALLQLRRQ